MINVPVLVKDALRKGTYRKNYRFIVEEIDEAEGFYEIARLIENQKIAITPNKTYKIVGEGENSWSGLTTWESWEPGTELESLSPSTTSPNTELVTLISEDIISVYGFNGITHVSLMEWREAKHEDSIIIDNNNLVKESVSIDERMNSGDKLKFGLCEGSSLEFQYFGKANIYGRRIQALLDVEYDKGITYEKDSDFEEFVTTVITEEGDYRIYSATPNAWERTIFTNGLTPTYLTPTTEGNETFQILDGCGNGNEIEVDWGNIDPSTHPVELQKKITGLGWFTIPMGFFDVEKCSRQASTGIMKVTAYNKLMSDYLDSNVSDAVMELVEEGEYGEDEKSIHTILSALLEGYGIDLRRPNISVPTFADMNGRGVYDFPLCDANGNLNGRHLWIYYCYPKVFLNEDNFYYFTLNTSNMLNYAEESVWGIYKDYYAILPGTTYVLTLEQMAQSDQIAIARPDAKKALAGYLFIGKNYKLGSQKKFADGYGGQPDIYTPELSRCTVAVFQCPIDVTIKDHQATSEDILDIVTTSRLFNRIWVGFHPLIIAEENLNEMEKMRLTTSMIEDINDVTLRELQSATYEISCQYGQLDRRTDLFSGVELNNSRLLPQDTLYPATSLYPGGAAASGFKSMYSKLWADEGNIHKWRYLIITYKGLDSEGNEVERTLQRTVNSDGTDNYNMSDNWLFRNLIWAKEDVEVYADAMAAKMRDITWFPFEMWAAGLPYLETGDEIEIPLGGKTYTSYILQRQLKGIQNLQDTYINGTLDIF